MAVGVHHHRGVRALFLVFGFVSLGVGLIGVVLPGIPTTGPVLLAAFFFARSSERFHGWMLRHRVFGPAIRDYQAGLGIPFRAKVIAFVMIAATFTVTGVVLTDSWSARSLLAATAAGIVAFIVSRPTRVATVVGAAAD